MDDRDGCTSEHCQQFDKLPYKKKVLFCAKELPYQSSFYLRSCRRREYVDDLYTYKYLWRKSFRLIKWLNNWQTKKAEGTLLSAFHSRKQLLLITISVIQSKKSCQTVHVSVRRASFGPELGVNRVGASDQRPMALACYMRDFSSAAPVSTVRRVNFLPALKL